LNDAIAGCTAALPLPLDTARRALNDSGQGGQRVLRRFNEGAAEQRHAPDREERGLHPQDAVLDTLDARRVMPSVRLRVESRET